MEPVTIGTLISALVLIIILRICWNVVKLTVKIVIIAGIIALLAGGVIPVITI